MTRRIYILGTDTGVGKTALTCALLHEARSCGLRAVPFKPAQSGTAAGPTDATRLLRAAGLDPSLQRHACPISYEPPVAPGIADDLSLFLGSAPARTPTLEPPLDRVEAALRRWETRTSPELTLIEGAGGLHVPMPGGTWQPSWIDRLADEVVVVGRLDLGTINHTLLTLDAAAHLTATTRGFYLVQSSPQRDPSCDNNARIITAARNVRHLGTLPFANPPDVSPGADLLPPLMLARP